MHDGNYGSKKRLIHAIICSVFMTICTHARAEIDPPTDELTSVLGVITSMNKNDVFTIEGSEFSFRFFEIELFEGFPKEELIGRRVVCHSIYPITKIREYQFSGDIIAVDCHFYSLFFRNNLNDALVDLGLGKRVCDPQGQYFLGCPFKVKEE